MGFWRIAVAGLALLGLVVVSGSAAAQTKPSKQARFPCGGSIVCNSGVGFQKVAFQLADVPTRYLSLQFVGHPSFLVCSPSEVRFRPRR